MHLIYTKFDDFYIVGTNETVDEVNHINLRANAISDPSYTGIIVIPKTYKGYPVKEVGHYAFYSCLGITNVIIEAELTAIHRYGFGNCPGIRTINIPKTVTFLDSFSIFSYDYRNHDNHSSGPTTYGYIFISIEEGSQLDFIGQSAFGRIEHIVIITVDKLENVKYTGNIARDFHSFDIYAKESFSFCGNPTKQLDNIDYYHDYNLIKSILNNMKHLTCKQENKINIFHSVCFIGIFILK